MFNIPFADTIPVDIKQIEVSSNCVSALSRGIDRVSKDLSLFLKYDTSQYQAISGEMELCHHLIAWY